MPQKQQVEHNAALLPLISHLAFIKFDFIIVVIIVVTVVVVTFVVLVVDCRMAANFERSTLLAFPCK